MPAQPLPLYMLLVIYLWWWCTQIDQRLRDKRSTVPREARRETTNTMPRFGSILRQFELFASILQLLKVTFFTHKKNFQKWHYFLFSFRSFCLVHFRMVDITCVQIFFHGISMDWDIYIFFISSWNRPNPRQDACSPVAGRAKWHLHPPLALSKTPPKMHPVVLSAAQLSHVLISSARGGGLLAPTWTFPALWCRSLGVQVGATVHVRMMVRCSTCACVACVWSSVQEARKEQGIYIRSCIGVHRTGSLIQQWLSHGVPMNYWLAIWLASNPIVRRSTI